MKKTDIATIILVASIGIVVAYFVASNLVFLRLPKSGVEVQTMTKIDSNVEQPDPSIFNTNAINPTVETVVGANQSS